MEKDNNSENNDRDNEEGDVNEEQSGEGTSGEQAGGAAPQDNTALVVAVVALIAIGVGAFVYSRFSSGARDRMAPPPAAAMPTTMELLSQPEGVVMLQYGALLMNEPQTLRQCFQVDSPEEQDLADAFVAMAQAIATLRNASDRRFGPGSFRELGIEDFLRNEIQQVSQAKVETEGTVSRIHAWPNRPPLIVNQQSDRTWKISLRQTFPDLLIQTEWTLSQAEVSAQLAADILAGRYNSPAAAREARLAMVSAASRRLPPPSSRPATGPSTAPAATGPSPAGGTAGVPATQP